MDILFQMKQKKKISEENKGKRYTAKPRAKHYWKLKDGTTIYMDASNAKRLYGKYIIQL